MVISFIQQGGDINHQSDIGQMFLLYYSKTSVELEELHGILIKWPIITVCPQNLMAHYRAEHMPYNPHDGPRLKQLDALAKDIKRFEPEKHNHNVEDFIREV